MWLTNQRIAFNIMLIGAMLGVSIATGEMVNESHVPVGKSGVMTSSARELKEVPSREIVQGRKLKEVPKWQMDSTEYLYLRILSGMQEAGSAAGLRRLTSVHATNLCSVQSQSTTSQTRHVRGCKAIG